MQGGVVELARQAAAAARAERAAHEAARRIVRKYRGVLKRGAIYVAEIMDDEGRRPVCLGIYATPEEAAYAYDAAARTMHGDKAKPNFPEPAPAPAPGRGGGAPVATGAGAGAGVLPPQSGRAGGVPAPRPQAPFFRAPAPVAAGAGAAQPGAPVSAAAGGSNGGAGVNRVPSGSGAYVVVPEPEEPVPTSSASSALSSTDKKRKSVIIDASPADPKEDRELPKLPILETGEAVVEDNFTGDGASLLFAAYTAAVRPLRMTDLMEVEFHVTRDGRADDGGAGPSGPAPKRHRAVAKGAQ